MALTRAMVGLPSQLGQQIINDICKKPKKLQGCCCDQAALAIWSMKLPVNVRAHISNMEFTKDTYKGMFEAADKVYTSARQISVAAVSLDETQSAFEAQNQPQVATFASKGQASKPQNQGNGGGGGKKNKKNKNQQNSTSRGKKHDSVPDSLAGKMCDRHFRHGGDAWYCLARSSCPWKDRCKPRD